VSNNLQLRSSFKNKGKGKSIPVTGLDRPLWFQEFEALRFPDNWPWRWQGCQSYAPATFTPWEI